MNKFPDLSAMMKHKMLFEIFCQSQMVLILFLFFIIVNLGCTEESRLPKRGVCAHRGANSTHPENTLSAFREAIRLGAHMIEFDVQLSKDGELVIMHDAAVDRTTNGHGRVADLTLAEIKSLDAGLWKGAEFKGEKVPTLAEALAIMPVNIWLNVHLKGGVELGTKVTQQIVKAGRISQTLLACKNEAAAAARQVEKHIQICNMDRQENSQRYVDETIARQADFIQLTTRADSILMELVPKLKQQKIRINYYGTNSPHKLKELFETEVEFPLVDELEAMLRAAEKLGIQPLKTSNSFMVSPEINSHARQLNRQTCSQTPAWGQNCLRNSVSSI